MAHSTPDPMKRDLNAAMLDVETHRWAGLRSRTRSVGQLRGAVKTLCEVIGRTPSRIQVGQVTKEHLRRSVDLWLTRDGLANTTVNVRLSTLSALGIDCTGNWRTSNIGMKWWLSPAKCAELLAYLRAPKAPFVNARLMADYVEWACRVGMRVEETLRLKWSDVHLDIGHCLDDRTGKPILRNNCEVTVPGTKTRSSQATIAIAPLPALVLAKRWQARAAGEERVFPISYSGLKDAWQYCRVFLGVADNPLSTLKALRRTAARHLTVSGMPLDVLRGYFRHESTKTTEGYLRLVGGYSAEEQRKWL